MIQKPNILLIGPMRAGKSTIAAELCNSHNYTRHAFAAPLKQLAAKIVVDFDKVKHRDLLQKLGTDIAKSSEWEFLGKAYQKPDPQAKSAKIEATVKLFRALGVERPQEPEAADEWWDRVRATERFLYSMEGTAAPFAQGFGDRGFWVNKAIEWLAERPQGEGPFVFDDCRFPEEREALTWYGSFKVVLVKTAPQTVTKRIKAGGFFDPAWLAHESEGHWRSMAYDAEANGSGDVKANTARLLQELV